MKPKVVRTYLCKKCGAAAKKTPLKALPNWRSAKPAEFGGLGTWHCTGGCRGKVKVTVKIEKIQPQKKAA